MTTPARAIRISDEVWEAARDKADQTGETMTGIIRDFLIQYGTEGPAEMTIEAMSTTLERLARQLHTMEATR